MGGGEGDSGVAEAEGRVSEAIAESLVEMKRVRLRLRDGQTLARLRHRHQAYASGFRRRGLARWASLSNRWCARLQGCRLSRARCGGTVSRLRYHLQLYQHV